MSKKPTTPAAKPEVKQVAAPVAAKPEAKAPEAKPAAKKSKPPANPFMAQHPGKPGRNANGKAHRSGR
jgi:hypothetical protein